MAKTYPLVILTPEREFFKGDVYSLTVESIDGQLCVLADHIPMVTALTAGVLQIEDSKGEHVAFHSEGFMQVARDEVTLLAQTCEWPEEIDARRAQGAAKRAQERLSSHNDAGRSTVALLRALRRLQVKESIYKQK